LTDELPQQVAVGDAGLAEGEGVGLVGPDGLARPTVRSPDSA